MTTKVLKTTYTAFGHAAYAMVYCQHLHRTAMAAARCAAHSEHFDSVESSHGEVWEVADHQGSPVLGRQLSTGVTP